jgi:hypothetical protein
VVPAVASLLPGEVDADRLNLGAQLLGLGTIYLMVRGRFLVSILPQHGPHHTVD